MNSRNRPVISHAWSALRSSSRQFCQASSQENAKDDILPPFKIHRSPTSVLEAMAKVSRRPLMHPDVHFNEPQWVKTVRHSSFDIYLTHKMRGRQSARYIIDNMLASNLAPLRTEEPRIHAFDSMITTQQLEDQEPTELLLERHIALKNVTKAWEVYELLDEVSSETKLKFLDLLCAYNSMEQTRFDHDPVEYMTSYQQIPQAHNTKRRSSFKRGLGNAEDGGWKKDGYAQQLFDTLDNEEKVAGYRALIRGMVRFGDYDSTRKVYAEMRKKGYVCDLQSYNALLCCAHHTNSAFDDPWEEGLRILKEMESNNIAPDAGTFNSLIFSLSHVVKKSWTPNEEVCQHIIQILKEMERLDIPVTVGTLTNVLKVAENLKNSDAGVKFKIMLDRLPEGGRIKDKFKSFKKVREMVSEMIDYVIEELAKDKGRKKLVTVADSELFDLMKKVKTMHVNPTEVFVKFHHLFIDSHGLAISRRKYHTFLSEVLSITAQKDPESCVQICEEAMNFTVDLRFILKLRIIDAYAKVAPERLSNFLVRTLNQICLKEHIAGLRFFLGTLDYVKSKGDACHEQLLYTLGVLWQRTVVDWDIVSNLKENYICNLFHLLLPKYILSMPSKEDLDLGLEVFHMFKKHKINTIYQCSHKLLQLAYGLLLYQRDTEAIEVLEAVVCEKRVVFKNCETPFDKLIDQMITMPAIERNQELLSKLEEHQMNRGLYEISETSEPIHYSGTILQLGNQIYEEESFEPHRTFKGKPSNRHQNRQFDDGVNAKSFRRKTFRQQYQQNDGMQSDIAESLELDDELFWPDMMKLSQNNLGGKQKKNDIDSSSSSDSSSSEDEF